MSGVKRAWLGGQFVQLHIGLLEALGGDYETAAVIWCVNYHAGVGSWAATREEFMQATALTRHKLDRALRRARDEGYLHSESKGGGIDKTLTWSVVYDESEPRVPESGTPNTGKRHQPVPESGTSPSYRSNTEGGPRKRAPSRKHPLPEDWAPNERARERAAAAGINLEREAAKFRAHAEANGRKQVSWDGAFTQWLLTAEGWAEERPGQNGQSRQRAERAPTQDDPWPDLSDDECIELRQWLWTHTVKMHDYDVFEDRETYDRVRAERAAAIEAQGRRELGLPPDPNV